jgi:enoyl-CoA hydratase/carnithine racemase
MTDDDTILLHRKGSTAYLVFNNPAKHNAVSFAMWQIVREHLQNLASSEDIRVVILMGAGGKAFVSGADISKFDDERASLAAVRQYNAQTQQVYHALESLPQPTIAMIDGYCIGGGLNLALACDVRICAETATFGLPAARLGLGYPASSLQRLINAVGAGRAKDIAFTGRRFDARKAQTIGLVQHVVSAEQLQDFVGEYAQAISHNAPLTVQALKAIVGELMKNESDRDDAYCQAQVDACFASADYIEGRRAFLAKRPPQFQGK